MLRPASSPTSVSAAATFRGSPARRPLMIGFSGLAQLLLRSRRMKAYRQARAEIEALSEADLADMGLKRYQLGHVARSKSLR